MSPAGASARGHTCISATGPSIMHRRSPPWGAIEAFVVAARVGSFKSAAAELGLSAAALSRRIQALEAHIGTRLFDRAQPVPGLTPAGRRYLQHLEPAYQAMREATDQMSPAPGVRALRVGVSQSLAISWLLPRLQDFRSKEPTIEVRLYTRSGNTDLRGGSADVGIVYVDQPVDGLISQRLLDLDAMLVCAPALAERVRDPGALQALPRLGSVPSPQLWPWWSRAAGDGSRLDGCSQWFDSTHVMYEAVALGLGVAIGVRPLVDAYLTSGRLVAPLSKQVRLPGAYHVAALPSLHREPAVRSFWRWLLAQAQACKARNDT